MDIKQTLQNTDFLILIILLAAYLLIEDINIVYTIIYIFLILNTIYKIYYKYEKKTINIKKGLLLVLIYPISYFLIIDPNPLYYSISFIFPFQNYFRMVFLLIFVSYLTCKILKKRPSNYYQTK